MYELVEEFPPGSIEDMKFIETQDEWSALMEESKSKLVVVDFTASWCGYVTHGEPRFTM